MRAISWHAENEHIALEFIWKILRVLLPNAQLTYIFIYMKTHPQTTSLACCWSESGMSSVIVYSNKRRRCPNWWLESTQFTLYLLDAIGEWNACWIFLGFLFIYIYDSQFSSVGDSWKMFIWVYMQLNRCKQSRMMNVDLNHNPQWIRLRCASMWQYSVHTIF